jgi:outer membrane protein assembly factor BamB
MPPQERKRRWRRIVLVLGIALVTLVGAAAAYVVTQEEDDVTNPDVEFRAEPTVTPEPEEEVEPEQPGKKVDPVDRFVWAHYGYTRDRRRFLPLKRPPRPPFREIWQYQGNILLEFPPVIGGKMLYLLNDSGVLLAINKHTGKVKWKRRLGALAAASPAYSRGKVYVVLLQRKKEGPKSRVGRVVALDAKKGKIDWARELASRSESSPLIADGRLYFGAENGTVYAMRAKDGNVQWRFRAGGAVKGGLALADGKLYFGAYGGTAYALWQRNGRVAWSTGTSGANFGLSAGNFYATPAVAFGRVFIGNTDGNMYSFSSETGELAWRRGTGSYVYASPAVAHLPGGRPTVYFGSYDGTFYALDARSGDTRWTHEDGGKISGAATVIGNIVYYSNWGKRNTTALGASTGRRVWTSDSGAFNPVISDGNEVYLTGFQKVMALAPKRGRGKN